MAEQTTKVPITTDNTKKEEPKPITDNTKKEEPKPTTETTKKEDQTDKMDTEIKTNDDTKKEEVKTNVTDNTKKQDEKQTSDITTDNTKKEEPKPTETTKKEEQTDKMDTEIKINDDTKKETSDTKKESRHRSEGLVNWLEFVTTDKNKSLEFFKRIFGWTSEVGDEQNYIQVRDGDKIIGGFQEQDKNTPKREFNTVNVYFCSNNADETALKVKENGGTIVKEPFDVKDIGRMAIFKDLEGGEFRVWQSKTHFGIPHVDDTDLANIPGFPVWFELNTRDLNRAINFYEKVFGWDHITKDTESNYTILFKGNEQVGGAIQISDEWPKETPSHWITYFQVNDVEGSEKLVKELGGNIAPPRSNRGLKEKISTVSDPTGITFQLTGNANLQDLRRSSKIEGEKKLQEDKSLKRKLPSESLTVDGIKGEQPETKKRKIS
jgi:predicted enzyme related to lactoylglutathione lyase